MISPKIFSISSRTKRTTAEARLSVSQLRSASADTPAERKAYHKMYATVLYGINYAQQTGRLHAGAESMLKEISGYQYAKLVCKLTNSSSISTIADVVKYLRGEMSIEA